MTTNFKLIEIIDRCKSAALMIRRCGRVEEIFFVVRRSKFGSFSPDHNMIYCPVPNLFMISNVKSSK